MRGIKEYDIKLQNWRERSKQHRQEKEKLKKRLKELELSRLGWKEKYKKKLKELALLNKEINQLKKGLIVKGEKETKVKYHHYTADQIALCLNLRNSGHASLRGCVKIIKVLNILLGLSLFEPSINSIRNWELKLGYDQLSKEKHFNGEMVLIIDESIMVGQQKLLLLMGVNLYSYNFEGSLSFKEVEVLGLHIGKSCNWQDVKQAIDLVKQRGYQLSYAVSDSGSSICKGLRASNLTRIEDCTHALGLLLKKRYKNDPLYDAFSKASTVFTRKICTSKYAAYMPPTQRSKARFLNLTPMMNWANKLLALCKKIKMEDSEKEIYELIKWIEPYEAIIEDLGKHQQLINQLLKILKVNGLSKASQLICEQKIDQSEVEDDFKSKLKSYLNRNEAKMPKYERLICCSDIIESTFGHFKNKMSSNKNIGFTASCLTVANTIQMKSKEEVKASLERVKIVDIQQWEKQNLSDSLLKRKRAVFKNITKKLG